MFSFDIRITVSIVFVSLYVMIMILMEFARARGGKVLLDYGVVFV